MSSTCEPALSAPGAPQGFELREPSWAYGPVPFDSRGVTEMGARAEQQGETRREDGQLRWQVPWSQLEPLPIEPRRTRPPGIVKRLATPGRVHLQSPLVTMLAELSAVP